MQMSYCCGFSLIEQYVFMEKAVFKGIISNEYRKNIKFCFVSFIENAIIKLVSKSVKQTHNGKVR